MKRSIKESKLFIRLFIVSATILMSGTAYFSYKSIHRLALESLKKNAFLETAQGVGEIDRWLSALKTHVSVLANTEVARSLDWSLAEPYLRTEVPRFPGIQTIAIGTPNGDRNAVDAKPANIKDRIYFQKAIAGFTYVSDPLISRAQTKPSISITTPIRATGHPGDHPIGELHSLVNLDRVNQVVNQIHYGNGSYAFVLSSDGKAIVHPNPAWISTAEKPVNSLLESTDSALLRIVKSMVSRQKGMELVQLDGRWMYIVYLPIQEAEWSIALVIPRANIESPLLALDLLASVIAGLSILLILFLWQVQAIEKRRLQRTKDELEHRVRVRTEELSIALQHLQQSQEQLQQVNDDLEQRVSDRTQELSSALDDLRRSKGQLIQSEKMSSLGQLVAGVAHEINNPVSFIYGNLDHANTYTENLIDLVRLYQKHYAPGPAEIQDAEDEMELEFLMNDLPKVFSSMKMGANRIKDIILSLRMFSRIDEAAVKAINIHDGLDSTLIILSSKLKAASGRYMIHVIKDYGEIPPVECYSGPLNQVFMNILSNAIDALEEIYAKDPNHVGSITITTSIVHETHVKIVIADNALGMPEAIRSNIFNPFFTTKPIGKGTGMGLDISYQIIVEKHGGTLECVSTMGQGTELVIQLPIVIHEVTSGIPPTAGFEAAQFSPIGI